MPLLLPSWPGPIPAPPFDAVGLLLHYLGPSGVLLLRDKLWPAGFLLRHKLL